MVETVVLVFMDDDDRNMYAINLSDYPSDRPRVGDILPLSARKVFRGSVGSSAVRDISICFLDGLYKVVAVREGSGYELHPKGVACRIWYDLDEALYGFGISLAKVVLPLDGSGRPVRTHVLFAR